MTFQVSLNLEYVLGDIVFLHKYYANTSFDYIHFIYIANTNIELAQLLQAMRLILFFVGC